MSFQLNLPPSVLSHMGKEEDANIEGGTEEKRKGREDYKKLKELEEARKAGTAPAMKDEHGKDINPHIPQYIMQAPWYYGATSATLRHQRQQEDQIPKYDSMNAWYKKGVKSGPIATKYRKGACENCGAMTHKKKDCLERPRKKGARFTGSNIAPDEHLQTDIKLDFEGKRDRWNGYDIDNHKKIIEDYAIMEEAKRMVKAQRLESDVLAGSPDDEKETSDGDEEDEDKYADEMDMPGQKFETKQRITVRNLRIREDTAKYLHNLDVNSAHYDPKTRSMRENPFKNKTESATYTGDNFVRTSGDAMEFAKRQMFAWDAYEKGTDVHLQADPTKLDVLAREYKKRKEDFKQSVKDNILDKYGGEEHLEAPPKQLLLAQTEDYIEYSRHGTVIKGQEKAKVKSRYEEDVYINNHTSVWGSFWKGGQWGYKCCHSTVQGSYCTGESGKQAAVQSVSVVAIDPQGSATQQKSLTKTPDRKRSRKQSSDNKKRRRKQSDSSSSSSSDSSSSSSDSSSSSSEDEDAAKERKIQEAMKKEAKRREEVDRLMALDERKRPYNSMCEIRQPTEEEMEAHRRTQLNPNDPMAAFLTKK